MQLCSPHMLPTQRQCFASQRMPFLILQVTCYLRTAPLLEHKKITPVPISSHDATPPTAIHAHSIVRPDGDAQARIPIFGAPSSPQSGALRLASFGLDDEPGGPAVWVFLLHELQLGPVTAAVPWRLWRWGRDEERG